MPLVGRRRSAIARVVELIKRTRTAERTFRTAAAAVARAGSILRFRQRVGDAELESLGKTSFYFDEQTVIIIFPNRTQLIERTEVRIRTRSVNVPAIGSRTSAGLNGRAGQSRRKRHGKICAVGQLIRAGKLRFCQIRVEINRQMLAFRINKTRRNARRASRPA